MEDWDPASHLADQLRAVAGRPPRTSIEDGEDFTIDLGGRTLSVIVVAGSTPYVELHVPYAPAPSGALGGPRLVGARPLDILLRPEHDDDRAAQADGTVVEHQTGDTDFDRTVFIETRCEPELLQALFAGRATRDAVRDILALGVEMLAIDKRWLMGPPDRIAVRFTVLLGDRDRGARAVEAMLRLVESLPHVTPSGVRRPRDGFEVFGAIVTGAAFVLGAGSIGLHCGTLPDACFRLSADGEGDDLVCDAAPACCSEPLLGVGLAFPIAIAAAIAVLRVMRGRATAQRHRGISAFLVAVVVIELGLAAAALAR